MIIHSYTSPGVKHVRRAQLSQDYVITATIDEKTRIIAVSDGVSSARFARNAAIAACYGAVNFSRNYPGLKSIFNNSAVSETFAKELLQHVGVTIEKLSKKNHGCMSDYAATLLVVIVTEDHYVLAIQLGDGFINIDGTNLAFKHADPHRKNVTFSTANLLNFDRNIYSVYRGRFSSCVIAMSDGLAPISDNRQLIRYLCGDVSIFGNIAALREVCGACSELNFDDTTIAIVTDPIAFIARLSMREQLTLFGLKERAIRLKNGNLNQYVRVFNAYHTPRSIAEVASIAHINAITVSKITRHLYKRNLLKKVGRYAVAGYAVEEAKRKV